MPINAPRQCGPSVAATRANLIPAFVKLSGKSSVALTGTMSVDSRPMKPHLPGGRDAEGLAEGLCVELGCPAAGGPERPGAVMTRISATATMIRAAAATA